LRRIGYLERPTLIWKRELDPALAVEPSPLELGPTAGRGKTPHQAHTQLWCRETLREAAKRKVAQDTTIPQAAPSPSRGMAISLRRTATGAQCIDIVSTDTGEVRATLLRFGNDSSMEWMVVTPDGLFDGTPGAWSQINWRFSDDTFDVVRRKSFAQERLATPIRLSGPTA